MVRMIKDERSDLTPTVADDLASANMLEDLTAQDDPEVKGAQGQTIRIQFRSTTDFSL